MIIVVRVIMIIGDGMADRPLRELNHQTPLEAAETKNMDQLASKGISGLLDPISPGIAPGSDAANLSILGYDPYRSYAGRGAFEAAGAGVELKPGDVAFRCNFATVNEDFIIVDERAGRIREDAPKLADALKDIRLRENSDIEVIFRHTFGFRGVLVLRGDRISPNVASIMPKAGDKTGLFKPLDASVEAKRTSNALNEFFRISHELLKNHPVNKKRRSERKPPANAIIPWGPGKLPCIKPFQKKYKLKAACIAAVSLIKGIAKLAGIKSIEVPGATGYIDTDTFAKADAALGTIKTYDMVILHVEGPDEASHEGNVEGKISIIRKIDSMVGRIIDNIDLDEVSVVLLADHATSIRHRKHTGDPVPIILASSEVLRDEVQRYNEREACRGGLGRIQGRHVMPLILNLIGRPEVLGG